MNTTEGTTMTTMTTMSKVEVAPGARVSGGKLGTEDHDEGRVVSVEGDTAYVAWDSGIRTHVAVASLTKL